MIKYIVLIIAIIFAGIIYDNVGNGPKLRNPYPMWCIFGKPGSGKSTVQQKLMYKHLKKGWQVYYDGNTAIPGIKKLPLDDFKKGKWLPDGRAGCPIWYDATNPANHGPINESPENILICIDEAGISYNNRDFKNNFTGDTLEWWKKHRHKRCKVIIASQTYKDMDLKLRGLTDSNYLMCKTILPSLRIAKRIIINFDIANAESGETMGGQIIEAYRYDLFIFHKYIWMWTWIKKFDSYA